MKQFYAQVHKGVTAEQCLTLLLKKITSCSEGFRITKQVIGPCWDNNCSEARIYLSLDVKIDCKNCYVSKTLKYNEEDEESGIKKLAFLVNNSEFKEIFSTMKVQLKQIS